MLSGRKFHVWPANDPFFLTTLYSSILKWKYCKLQSNLVHAGFLTKAFFQHLNSLVQVVTAFSHVIGKVKLEANGEKKMKFTMYQLDRVLQQSWTTHMGVKISFADFLSIYENLTFKSSTNERIRWFFILSFGSIWRYFETTRRCLFASHFSL